MKIELTNSQADIQIIADQLNNLRLADIRPNLSHDATVELYQNEKWLLAVDWKESTMTIEAI